MNENTVLPISWPPPNPTTNRKKPTALSSTKQMHSVLCPFIKRLHGYFIYNHTVQVLNKDVNQKEHEDERVQQ